MLLTFFLISFIILLSTIGFGLIFQKYLDLVILIIIMV